VTSDFDRSGSRSGSPRTSGGGRAVDPKTWSPENDEEIVKKYNNKGKTVMIESKLFKKVTLLCSLYLQGFSMRGSHTTFQRDYFKFKV
jgi:hypothetical protein